MVFYKIPQKIFKISSGKRLFARVEANCIPDTFKIRKNDFFEQPNTPFSVRAVIF